MKNRKQLVPIISVIAIGAVLASLILAWDKTPGTNSAHSLAGAAHEPGEKKPGVPGEGAKDCLNQRPRGRQVVQSEWTRR